MGNKKLVKKAFRVSVYGFIFLSMAFGLPIATQAAAPDNCPAEMISYWKLDDNFGQPYADTYGTNEATCTSCPAATAGLVGDALQFDGIDDEVDVNYDDPFDWEATDEFSIEFWMKTEPTSTCSGNEVIVGRQGPTHPNPHWWVGCSNGGNQAIFVLLDQSGGDGGNGIWPAAGTDITDGNWHHIAAVKDATHIHLYVDGVGTSVDKSYSAGFDSTTPLNIGYLNLSGHYRYTGSLDEIAIYDKALAATEIQQHHADGLSGFAYCQVSSTADTDNDGIMDGVEGAASCCLDPNDDDTDDDGILDGNEDSSHDCAIDPGETDPCDIDSDGDGILDGTEVGLAAPQGLDTDLADFVADADGGATTTNPLNADTDGDGVDDGVEDANQNGAVDPGESDPAVNENCTAGMIAYWKLDETDASTVFSDSYNGHDGDGSASPPLFIADSIVGAAQFFDGTDDRIQIPSSTDFDIAVDGSFSAFTWFKKTSDCGSNQGSQNEVMINRTFPGQHGSNTWWFGCHTNDQLVVMFFPALKESGGDDGIVYSGVTVDDGEWHYGGWVYDGDANELRLYLDGQLKGIDSINLTGDFNSTNPLCIGGYDVDGSCDTYEYQGILDEVAIYNYALTALEIQQQYVNGQAGFGYCEPVAPQIVSAAALEATVGQLYVYDVEAVGNPAPTYALTQNPPEMAIDPPTGLIEWTPTGTGDFDVCVDASYDLAIDTQCFTISVAGAGDCPAKMVSFWKLDETGTPTSFGDIHGTNDGTCAGADCPTPAAGIINGAMDFDGGDEIYVSDDPSLHFTATDSFTVEVWIKTNQVMTGNKVFIGKHLNSGEAYWWFGGTGSDGTVEFEFLDSDGVGAHLSTATSVNDDVWHHLAAVVSRGSNTVTVYIDGVSKVSETYSFTGDFTSTRDLHIGHYLGSYNYDGLLDEVAVYRRALLADEIEAHFNNGVGKGYCEPSTDFCLSGTDAYYPLDEPAAPYTDKFGGDDADCSNCPTAVLGIVGDAQQFDGVDDEVTIPDDASTAYFDWAQTDSFSVEYWMWTDQSTSGNRVIVGRDGGPTNLHWWIGCDDSGKVRFQLRDTTGNGLYLGNKGPVLNDGMWHHIVAVRQYVDGEPSINSRNQIYVDGVLIDEGTYNYGAGFEEIVGVNVGYILLSHNYRYAGRVDELAFYDKALTEAEIQQHFINGLDNYGSCEAVAPQIVSVEATDATVGQLYIYDVNALGNPGLTYALTQAPAGMTVDPLIGLIEWIPTGVGDFNICAEATNGNESDTQCFTIRVAGPAGCPAGMAHYWKLDETVGSIFTDVFGGTDGTCTDCPARTDGILGSARGFNGSSNEINVPDDGSFDWQATDEFSIELWMKRPLPQPIPENDVIIGRDDPGSNLHWWVGINKAGYPIFVLLDRNGGNGGNGNWAVGDTDITNDQWHHIVAVKDATHIRIYVDGVEKSQVAKSYVNGFDGNVPLNIGWLSLDKKYTFDGSVDEVSLYNRALTLDEIQGHYNEGAGRGYCSPSTPPADVDLISYWRLDEDAPSFYEDVTGTNDGGCRAPDKCPVPTAAGKLGGGQVFDRASQSGINAPAQDFNWGNADSFTVAFWMKKESACAGTAISDNEVIVGRDDVNSNLHWWVGVGCYSTYPQQGGAAFNLIDTNTGEANTAIYGETNLTDGKWHFVVAQRDGQRQENRLYVDGKLESKISLSYSDGFDSTTELVNIGWLNLNPNYYYSGILDEVAIYNSVLSEPEIRFLYYLGRDYRDRCSSPIRVMELGDSITYDNYSGDPRPAGLRTGYRSHLWWMLTDAGYHVDFVGSVVAGQNYIPAFDPDNAGYPGATDDQIAGLLDTGVSPKPGYPGTPAPGGPYLDYYQPDVVLLHIGTNGLCSSGPACADAVASILDEVDEYELRAGKDAIVLLSRIIARQGDNCSGDTGTIFNTSTNTSTSAYNNYVEDMVLNRIAGGDAVVLLDMECGANINYSTDMIDTLHPTDAGYAKMAGVWMNGNSHADALGLTDILPVCGPPEPAQPVVTSEPPLQAYTGWYYQYDVEADGYPAPEYRLAASPAGMTIDPASGLITWLAGAIGDYNVIVEAFNSEAAVPQEFTIHVAEAPPCPDDMAHYWKLDEVSDGMYNDLVSGNSGECAGSCPAPEIGIASGAQVFNRGTGTGINVPPDASFDWGGADSFSIEFWMRKDPGIETCSGSDTDANEVIIGRDDATSQLHWWIGIGCNTSYPIQGGAVFNLIDTNAGESGTADISGRVGTSIYGSRNLVDGAWHHVVVVRDGAAHRLFVDGILEDSMTLAYSHGFDSASAPINIGWLNLSGGFRFSGSLDEVAVYNRALELDEIQQHASKGQCGKGYCEPAELVDVPDVTGMPRADAEAVIVAAKLRVGTVIPIPSETIPAWEVISQNPAAGIQLPDCSAVNLVISAGDVASFQSFEEYAAGTDPPEWMDTGANNSLVEDDSLFKVYDVGGQKAFGTASSLTNIHSHYVAAAYDAANGFIFTGRLRKSAANSSIGMTFLSDYSNSDTYHRLRSYSNSSLHLSPHPHGTAVAGDTDSGVIPTANTWYMFKIEVIDTGSRTEIRANIWAEGSGEPADWQIEAYDDSPTRLTVGAIGVWSMGPGSKYWDDLAVEMLAPVNRQPVANCTVNPLSGAVPLWVDLDGSSSYDPDGSIVLYEWDFEGDGVYERSNPASGITGYNYDSIGTYNAALRVTDNEGATGTVAVTVTVSEANEPARIESHPSGLEVTEGEAATFVVVAAGTEPLNHQWQRRNGTDWEVIDGATGSSYTISETIFPEDNGASFRCFVSNAVDLAGVYSNEAILTVAESPYDYFNNFNSYAAGTDPPGWMDTGANNSLVEDDSLFKVYDVGGQKAFGTASSLTNIHSHYVAAAYDATNGFIFAGRLRMSAANSGIGMTFLSDYPNSDTYHRLRSYNNSSLHLSPHPHGTTVAGDTDSEVIPTANTWYMFKIEVIDTGSRTEIRAIIWAEDTTEPADWQIDAYDDSPTRPTVGAIGVWSMGPGSKYWDDLAVLPLTP